MENTILYQFEQDGRKINAGGMCYGIAMAVIDYVLKCSELKQSDQKQLQPLGDRLREIITCQDEDKDKEKQVQRSAFFDAIMLYHSSGLDKLLEDEKSLAKLKQNFPPHPNYQTSFWAWDILNNDSKNTQPLHENYSFILHAPDSMELESNVITTLERLRQETSVFCAILSTHTHTMAAVYDQGRWWLINHDLFMDLNSATGYLENSIVSIKVLSTVKEDKQENLFRDYNNILPEDKSQWCDYLYLAMSENNLDGVQAYFNALKEEKDLNEEQRVSLIRAKIGGTPALYIAMQNDNPDGVQAYFNALKYEKDLTSEKRVSLIRAESRDGNPALCVAMYNNSPDCVREYFNALKEEKDLTDEQRIALIRAENTNGTPALFKAMQNNSPDGVRAYFNALNEQNLSPEQRISLIRAETYGLPALFIAMHRNNPGGVRAYLNALKEGKDLTSDQRISLIRAENRNGTPALFIAMYNNSPDGVRAYFNALNDQKLSPEQRISLIQAENRDGTPALFIAMKNNNPDGVRAYFEALNKQKLSPEQRISLIRSDRRDGTPALYIAMQKGHADCVRAYFNALKEEKDLTGEQRISLIRAGNIYGTTALFIAMLNIKTDCVRAYYDFLVNDNHLSEDDLICLVRAVGKGLMCLEWDLDAYIHEKYIDIYFHAVYQICQRKGIEYSRLVPDAYQERYRNYSNNKWMRDSITYPLISSAVSRSEYKRTTSAPQAGPVRLLAHEKVQEKQSPAQDQQGLTSPTPGLFQSGAPLADSQPVAPTRGQRPE